MPVEVREARVEDASYLARNLRHSDRVEVLALIGPQGDVARAIRQSIIASPSCGTVWADEHPLFIIGAADHDGLGYPWLVATDEVRHYPKAMTEITKQFIVRWMERWPRLLNYVDARNRVSMRWLQHLGFAIHEPLTLGVAGERFYPFTMGV